MESAPRASLRDSRDSSLAQVGAVLVVEALCRSVPYVDQVGFAVHGALVDEADEFVGRFRLERHLYL